MRTDAQSFLRLTVNEDFREELLFDVNVESTYSTVRVFKDAVRLPLSNGSYEHSFQQNIGTGDRHTLTIVSAKKEDAGVFQFEVGNLAGTIVKYYALDVRCK